MIYVIPGILNDYDFITQTQNYLVSGGEKPAPEHIYC